MEEPSAVCLHAGGWLLRQQVITSKGCHAYTLQGGVPVANSCIDSCKQVRGFVEVKMRSNEQGWGGCFSGNLQALPPRHQSLVFVKFQARTFVLLEFLFKKEIIVGAKALRSWLWIWGLQPWYPLKFWHFPLAMTFTLGGDLLVLEEFPAVNLQVNKIIVCSNNNKEMCTIRPGMIDNLAKMVSFFSFLFFSLSYKD